MTVRITWSVRPEVPQGYEDATRTTVNHWINQHWQSWPDGHTFSQGMNVEPPGHPVIGVGVRGNFSHPEGHPPTAKVTHCSQVFADEAVSEGAANEGARPSD